MKCLIKCTLKQDRMMKPAKQVRNGSYRSNTLDLRNPCPLLHHCKLTKDSFEVTQTITTADAKDTTIKK